MTAGGEVQGVWRRARREALDLLELVLLPGLAALLPWPLAFRLLRVSARCPWLYRQACTQALAAAQAHGMAPDSGTWLREHRLMMLVDHADLYLARTRSDRWLRRYVDVQGDWGVRDHAALLVTFHWAAGMWAHRHARASGLRPHMLLARQDRGGYVGRWVLGRYARARARAVALADGQDVIWVPGAMPALTSALARQEQIVVVLDVPPDQVKETAPQQVLGRRVHMPIALPRLAVRQRLPVTVFTLGLDVRTGRRDLRLYPLGAWDDAQALSARIFQEFDRIVRERPAHWHFWSVAQRFFADRPVSAAAFADSPAPLDDGQGRTSNSA